MNLPTPYEIRDAVNDRLAELEADKAAYPGANWADLACTRVIVGTDQDGDVAAAVWVEECSPSQYELTAELYDYLTAKFPALGSGLDVILEW